MSALRFVYLAGYQGPAVVTQRTLAKNRALGATRKIELLTRGLVANGHKVVVFSAATPAERSGAWFPAIEEQIETGGASVTVRYAPGYDRRRLNRLVAFAGHFKLVTKALKQADVAIVYNISPESVWWMWRAKRLGTAVVLEYEDDAAATLLTGRERFGVGTLLVAAARRTADVAAAVNPSLLAQLAPVHGFVVPGIVECAANGNEKRPSFSHSAPLRVLYCGGLTSAKGVDLAIEAVLLCPRAIELTIAGEGPLRQQVVEAAARSGRIRFLGEVTREVLEVEQRQCHVLVNPHRVARNGLGTFAPFKLLEYAAVGAPIVSSEAGLLEAELQAGLVVCRKMDAQSLAQALIAVADDYERLNASAQSVAVRVRREYSAVAIARTLVEALYASGTIEEETGGKGAERGSPLWERRSQCIERDRER